MRSDRRVSLLISYRADKAFWPRSYFYSPWISEQMTPRRFFMDIIHAEEAL